MYPYKRLIGLIERKGYKMKITQITVVVAHVVIMLLLTPSVVSALNTPTAKTAFISLPTV